MLEILFRIFPGESEPMPAFFERCEELWLAQAGGLVLVMHYRNESQAVVFPRGCRELREVLNAAAARGHTARSCARGCGW